MACKRVVADQVRLRVICQLYLVGENFFTFTAVKEVFNAMLQRLVFFELRFLRVALVADIASERLLTCVVACVRDQCALALEPFPASVTVDHIACFQRSDTNTLTTLHSFYFRCLYILILIFKLVLWPILGVHWPCLCTVCTLLIPDLRDCIWNDSSVHFGNVKCSCM